MRLAVVAFLALVSAFGQQFEVLNSNLPGLVARDSQGNWIVADGVNALRSNDRAILDRHWADRSRLADLALRRCLLGLEADDPDDRLLNWFWAFLTEPSWTVS